MSPAVLQLLSLLLNLAVQAAPEIEQEATIVFKSIKTGLPPTDAEIAQLDAAMQNLNSKADADFAAKLAEAGESA